MLIVDGVTVHSKEFYVSIVINDVSKIHKYSKKEHKIKAVKLAVLDASADNERNPYRRLCCPVYLDTEDVIFNYPQYNEITDVHASACEQIRFNEDDENMDITVIGTISDEAFEAIIHHYQYRLGGGRFYIEI